MRLLLTTLALTLAASSGLAKDPDFQNRRGTATRRAFSPYRLAETSQLRAIVLNGLRRELSRFRSAGDDRFLMLDRIAVRSVEKGRAVYEASVVYKHRVGFRWFRHTGRIRVAARLTGSATMLGRELRRAALLLDRARVLSFSAPRRDVHARNLRADMERYVTARVAGAIRLDVTGLARRRMASGRLFRDRPDIHVEPIMNFAIVLDRLAGWERRIHADLERLRRALRARRPHTAGAHREPRVGRDPRFLRLRSSVHMALADARRAQRSFQRRGFRSAARATVRLVNRLQAMRWAIDRMASLPRRHAIPMLSPLGKVETAFRIGLGRTRLLLNVRFRTERMAGHRGSFRQEAGALRPLAIDFHRLAARSGDAAGVRLAKRILVLVRRLERHHDHAAVAALRDLTRRLAG